MQKFKLFLLACVIGHITASGKYNSETNDYATTKEYSAHMIHNHSPRSKYINGDILTVRLCCEFDEATCISYEWTDKIDEATLEVPLTPNGTAVLVCEPK